MSAIRVPIDLRWADQDPYGHVNNVALTRILEEARARAFWAGSEESHPEVIFPPLEPGQPVWGLVAELRVKYLRPLDYHHEPVTVEMTVSRIGGANFTIDYAVFSATHESTPCATAQTTLVMVNRDSGAPVRLSKAQREQLSHYAAEPQNHQPTVSVRSLDA